MIKEYILKVTNKVLPNAFSLLETEYPSAQELVRCKDCKYWNPWNCKKEGGIRCPDWFCADAERKEGR